MKYPLNNPRFKGSIIGKNLSRIELGEGNCNTMTIYREVKVRH